MSMFWMASALDDEYKARLDRIGVSYPDILSSRLPTGQDIKDIFENLPDFSIEILSDGTKKECWKANIELIETGSSGHLQPPYPIVSHRIS